MPWWAVLPQNHASLAVGLLRQTSTGPQEACRDLGHTFAVDQILGLVGLIKHLQTACEMLVKPSPHDLH